VPPRDTRPMIGTFQSLGQCRRIEVVDHPVAISVLPNPCRRRPLHSPPPFSFASESIPEQGEVLKINVAIPVHVE
jgi:hypothetical protein